MPAWEPNPNITDYQCDELIDETGAVLARIEDFGYASYPTAYNALERRWERGGPMQDRVAGMLWAERVAGLHPTKAGDERPAFYYMPKEEG